MSNLKLNLTLLYFVFFTISNSIGQCDSVTPSMDVDLSASPNMSWSSPLIARDGNCCGTTNPDNCIEFVISLHPLAVAISFEITDGAIPPGAMFYQIGCGPPTPVGTPICLDGPGPHVLTFCKPGNNVNEYSITSYSDPIIGPDISLGAGCVGFIHAEYYNEPSMTWTSVSPGVVGQYDYLLSCDSGCDTTYLEAPIGGLPSSIEYLVCGTDLAGCNPLPQCDTITVNFVNPIELSVSSLKDTLCQGETTTLSLTSTGGNGVHTYVWSTSETTSSIVVGPGVYYVDVTDEDGCHVYLDSIEVFLHNLPLVNAGVDQVVCEGTLVVLNGVGADSYAWDNGVTDGVPFVQAVGTITYSVIGTDLNGCENTDQVDVTVNPLPLVNAGLDQVVCEGETVTLNGAGANAYAWDNGVIDGVPFIQAVGIITYTLTGTDINGCSSTDQVDVTVNALPIVSAGVDQIVCEGTAVTLSGAGANSYVWDNGVIDGVPFVQAVGLMSYTVTGTDINGCVNTDQVDVTVNALPIVDAGIDQQMCIGSTITLNGAGANSYAWDNAVMDGVPFVQAVGTITYSVIGTDLNGCENTDQVDVTVNPLPLVNAGLDQVVCEGETVTLNGAGANAYAWDNGVINGVPFIQAVGTITYTLTGTDINGCSSTDQVDVTVNALPMVSAGVDQIVCEGTAVTLSGSGANSYVWDNGVIDGVPFIQAVGLMSYTVTGTDINGCVNTDQVDVTVNALPIVDAGIDQQMCMGSTVTLNGAGASSYVWDNGVTDGVPFGQPVGTMTYTVVGTDLNGCQNTDNVDVTVYALPIISAGMDEVVCEGTQVTLSGTGGVVYLWDNAVTDGVPFVPAVGTMTYNLIGTDINGCSNLDQVDVTVNALPVVSAGGDQQECENYMITLSGTGANTYVWDNGVINGVPFNAPIGITTYTVVGTDNNGCSNSDQVDVEIYNLPNVIAGPDVVVCELAPVVLSGAGAVNYTWTGGVIDAVAFTPSVGSHDYIVSGTDLNGCVQNDTVNVLVNPKPIVNAGPDQSLCSGDILTLVANGTGIISWDNGVIDGVPFAQAIGVVVYTVQDSLSTGCTAHDQVQIIVNPNPVISANNAEICLGEGVTLNGEGASSYSWTGGVIDGVEFFPTISQDYFVTGTDINGCQGQAVSKVIVHDLPDVDFDILDLSLNTSNPTTGFDNLTIGGDTYTWDFGDGSMNSFEFEPTHTFPDDQAGEYAITLDVETVHGCHGQKIKYVHVFQDYTIYVPNAFTPDGSGVNEIFKPVMTGFDPQDYTMYIFNRWGDLIFETHDMEIGWDGKFAGQNFQVQDGVYTWKIEAGLKDSADTKLFVGHVSILK